MQHRQLAAFNKHRPQELLSHRNCGTASSSCPMAMGTGVLHPTNSRWEHKELPAGLQWTLSPPQDPSGASPDASCPAALCSLLCLLTNLPGVTCQVPPVVPGMQQGARGVEGQSRECFLMEHTSPGVSEDFQDTGEREGERNGVCRREEGTLQ